MNLEARVPTASGGRQPVLEKSRKRSAVREIERSGGLKRHQSVANASSRGGHNERTEMTGGFDARATGNMHDMREIAFGPTFEDPGLQSIDHTHTHHKCCTAAYETLPPKIQRHYY